MRIQLFVIVGFLLATATAAEAQEDTTESALRWFNSFDQNGDGVMAKDEVLGISEKQFARADADQDGQISLEEYTFGIPADRPDELAKTQKRFSFMDRDENGQATRDEYVSFSIQVIDLADSNADGKMSREEFLASISSPSE
jgi:Ca2+-binding EF-hand superfamily protein